MAFDDLDLEFEDEEEQKRKKNDAVHVDVDLEFAAPEGAKPRPMPANRPVPPGAAKPPQATVTKIDEARAAQQGQPVRPVARPAAAAASPAIAQPRVVGATALKQDVDVDVESAAINEMREQMRKMEVESQVKVQVAEFKTEYLTEMLSDMKLMEHQIGQLIARINAKHPDMKNEVLMIKKILADFTSKKRK